MLGLPRYVLPLRINSEHLDVPFYGLHKAVLQVPTFISSAKSDARQLRR